MKRTRKSPTGSTPVLSFFLKENTLKIKPEQFEEFIKIYSTDDFYKHLRFGQAFIAHFSIEGSYPEIFYEGDEQRAISKIKEIFVSEFIQLSRPNITEEEIKSIASFMKRENHKLNDKDLLHEIIRFIMQMTKGGTNPKLISEVVKKHLNIQ